MAEMLNVLLFMMFLLFYSLIVISFYRMGSTRWKIFANKIEMNFKNEVLAKGEFKKDINATIIFKDGKFVDIQVNLDKEPVE